MNKLSTSVSEIYIDEDGILIVRVLSGAVITEEKAVEMFNASETLLAGRKALVLFDATEEYELTEGAKRFGSSQEVANSRIATALVTNSIANRMMLNLYMTVYKPAVPTKMFTSRESAMKWLKSFYVLPGDKFVRKKKK